MILMPVTRGLWVSGRYLKSRKSPRIHLDLERSPWRVGLVDPPRAQRVVATSQTRGSGVPSLRRQTSVQPAKSSWESLRGRDGVRAGLFAAISRESSGKYTNTFLRTTQGFPLQGTKLSASAMQ